MKAKSQYATAAVICHGTYAVVGSFRRPGSGSDFNRSGSDPRGSDPRGSDRSGSNLWGLGLSWRGRLDSNSSRLPLGSGGLLLRACVRFHRGRRGSL